MSQDTATHADHAETHHRPSLNGGDSLCEAAAKEGADSGPSFSFLLGLLFGQTAARSTGVALEGRATQGALLPAILVVCLLVFAEGTSISRSEWSGTVAIGAVVRSALAGALGDGRAVMSDSSIYATCAHCGGKGAAQTLPVRDGVLAPWGIFAVRAQVSRDGVCASAARPGWPTWGGKMIARRGRSAACMGDDGPRR